MKPSGPRWLSDLYTALNSTGPETLALTCVTEGARTAHLIRFAEPQATQAGARGVVGEQVERFVCQVLVSALPAEAMPELKDTLLDFYDYYQGVPSAATFRPALVPYTAAYGTTRPRRAIRLED